MKRKSDIIDELIGSIKASILLLMGIVLGAFAFGSSLILLFKFLNWLFLL